LSKITQNSKVKRAEMSASILRNKGTSKQIEKSFNFTVEMDDIDMPNTVFQTTDEVSVMEAVQSLIKQHVDYSDEKSSNYSQFSDPEFKADFNSIYLQNDLDGDDKKDFIQDQFSKIKWFRPKHIVEDDEFGFDSLSGKKRTDVRISQGNLKDNWFLSALSIIVTEETLFQNLTCDQQFDRFRSYGLYVFKFYKDGTSYFVIVDDKIPCIERKNGTRVPFFAKCQDPSLFWVCLIEKAYAKLHKRYWALTNGTVEDALHDLTGIYPERMPVDHSKYTDISKLYDAMKILTLSGALIGTALIYEDSSVNNTDQAKQKNEAKLKGLQPGVYYSVLD